MVTPVNQVGKDRAGLNVVSRRIGLMRKTLSLGKLWLKSFNIQSADNEVPHVLLPVEQGLVVAMSSFYIDC